MLDEGSIWVARSSSESKMPCLISRRCRIEKKISTWLSHEACLVERLSRIPTTDLSGGNLVLEAVEEGDEVKAVARLGGHPRDLAGMHLKRREEVLGSVAHVLVVAPGGLGGRWGAVGARPLAWTPVFSSIETTIAFSGGSR